MGIQTASRLADICFAIAAILMVALLSIKLSQARMGLDKDPLPCFCDVCVKENYPDNGNGISYGTEGK